MKGRLGICASAAELVRADDLREISEVPRASRCEVREMGNFSQTNEYLVRKLEEIWVKGDQSKVSFKETLKTEAGQIQSGAPNSILEENLGHW